MQSKPLFLEPQALQQITPEHTFFSPDHKKRKGRYLRPFLILMFVSPGHKNVGKSYRNLRKSPQHILHLTLFLRIPVLPPLSPKSMGGMLDIHNGTNTLKNR